MAGFQPRRSHECPLETLRGIGYQLHFVQMGEMPDDWKVPTNQGKGVTGIYGIGLST
ncbi:MAG: phage-related protein [Granulosicoccus sp.]|jgi:phage-related protein